MKVIEIKKGANDEIIVRFPYNPSYVKKTKSIKGHHWHPGAKYWSFPSSNGIIEGKS
ncbi:hypothetical protein KAW18_07490 [candidate division WOR-3 bacterium]|nr:hypothetical protein [candidate division WOR-3 bacterium]MCK4527200.1 hypothetical protein [candidate division WOR-3 bacterium]